MAKTVGLLEKIAAAKCNVLITGETGTGKELAALLIHQRSRRRDARLVSLNCAAFPDSLLENELFGYERGARSPALTSEVKAGSGRRMEERSSWMRSGK